MLVNPSGRPTQMRPTDRAASPIRTLLRLLSGAAGSLLAHALLLVVIAVYGELPSIDGEFSIPSEIEFGVVDGIEADVAAEAAPPQAPPPAAAAETETPASDEIALDAGRPRRDAGIRDAGVGESTDGGEIDGAADGAADGSLEAGPAEDAGVEVVDAGRGAPRVARGTEGGSRQVAGAQLTLRIDFSRVRGTSLERVSSDFLMSIRDFQSVLGGSGIDPVRDLEQFLMSSPDPTNRSRYAFLGRSRHDRAWARERVAALATRSGRPAEWTTRFGYESAPWQDEDDVGRIVLLLDDQHFLLCRERDAARVLGWLRSVAENADRPISEGPALALGVAEHEVVSFEGLNLTAYAQGAVAQYVPSTARVSILTDEGHHFDLAVRAVYEESSLAETGSAYWDELRRRTAGSAIAQYSGMSRVLDGLEPTLDEHEVRAQTSLNSAQVVSILGLIQMQIAAMYARWDRQHGDRPAPTSPP